MVEDHQYSYLGEGIPYVCCLWVRIRCAIHTVCLRSFIGKAQRHTVPVSEDTRTHINQTQGLDRSGKSKSRLVFDCKAAFTLLNFFL
jgi:hypothetical protein